MIKATFMGSRDNYLGFYVTGHAGYANSGKDIVCSGVSALAISTANALSKRLGNQVRCGQIQGFLFVKLSNQLNEEEKKISQIILDSCYEGMVSVENEYGNYLKVVLQEG